MQPPEFHFFVVGEELSSASGFPVLSGKREVRREALKTYLVSLAGEDVQPVEWSRGIHGKPFIRGLPFRFNYAFSGAWLVLATHHEREVGIDIEFGVDACAARELPGLCLSKNELDFFGSLPRGLQVDVFHRFWILKEAILKASGEGLIRNMQEVEVEPFESNVSIRSLPLSYGCTREWGCGIEQDTPAGPVAWSLAPGNWHGPVPRK